jgi:hypothetical protein
MKRIQKSKHTFELYDFTYNARDEMDSKTLMEFVPFLKGINIKNMKFYNESLSKDLEFFKMLKAKFGFSNLDILNKIEVIAEVYKTRKCKP